MQYRRPVCPGGSFFFTVITEKRRHHFATVTAIEILREAFRRVRKARPFTIEAIVVLPNHLHCIWTLPPGDTDYSTRWRLIKSWFTKHCPPGMRATPSPGRSAKGEQAVWQPRFWDHLLRDDTDYIRHMDYIHYNPVKHGLATSAMAWPYSSFRRHVKLGNYPADWGQGELNFEGIGHE